MKYIYTILSLALFTSCNMPAETKTDTGEPEGPHTSSEWQIWAYSTAAPDYIAADATVFDGPPDMGGIFLERDPMDGLAYLRTQDVNLILKMDGLMHMKLCLYVVMQKSLNGLELTLLEKPQ